MAMTKLVNKQSLAELQGVSLPTIAKWLTKGMPYEQKGGRGKGYKFNPAKVTEWRIAQNAGSEPEDKAESEAKAKQRKTTAEADMAEMKAAQTRGDLVKVEDIARDIQNDLLKVKARLLAIPNRAAPQVVGMGQIEAREFLTELICDALDELATADEDDALVVFDPHIHARQKLNRGMGLHSGRFTSTLIYDVENSSPEVTFSEPESLK